MCPHVTLLERDTWKLAPTYSYTFFHMPFPFADFNLCSFTVKNHNHEWKDFYEFFDSFIVAEPIHCSKNIQASHSSV